LSGKSDITELLNIRKQLISSKSVKFSVNDVIIKNVALSLQLNRKFLNENEIDSDISVAVATPNGLITPIVKSANNLNVVEISEKMRDLVERARTNSLKLNEFVGGSFSISNLGMYGIYNFRAIINPPQKGILAVGGSVEELVKYGENISKKTYLN